MNITIPKILSQITLVNSSGVLVLLDKFSSPTLTTPSGIEIPAYDTYYTEGGKHAAKHSDKEFSSQGTVIAISPTAAKYVTENWAGSTLSPGDRVWIQPTVANNRSMFELDRLAPVIMDQPPYIIIHPTNIEAKLPESAQIEYV